MLDSEEDLNNPRIISTDHPDFVYDPEHDFKVKIDKEDDKLVLLLDTRIIRKGVIPTGSIFDDVLTIDQAKQLRDKLNEALGDL